MAISTTSITKLPLDTWARLIGFNPFYFNGISAPSSTMNQGGCQSAFYQTVAHDYPVSREEVSDRILEAEDIIESFVNFNLMPDYDIHPVKPPRFYQVAYRSALTTQGRPKSVQLPKRYLRHLGVKTQSLIEAGATVTRVDNDNDGFFETCTVTITTDIADDEIGVFYPSEDGNYHYEIRPIKITDGLVAGTKVLSFPVWQAVQPDLLFQLNPVVPLDPEGAIYLTTVDVYRTYLNTTNPINLIYNPDSCGDCKKSFAQSCGYIEDYDLGYVVYNPTFTGVDCRVEPDLIEISYQSGYVNTRQPKNRYLDNYWATAVAYFSSSLFTMNLPLCTGTNDNQQRIITWREPLENSQNANGYNVANQAFNPTGVISKGGYYAWQKALTKRVP